MGNKQIKQLGLALGALFLIILFITGLHNHKASQGTPLNQIDYTDSISNTSAVYYTNKGLETQPLSALFGNAATLQNSLSSDRYSNTIAALKLFVNTQSHYDSHNPEIANVSGGGNSYSFKLFIETSETFYDVHLVFDGQDIPHLTYEVDSNAQI